MRNSQVKPWQNKDGSVKSDAELREAGQQWPSGVWEKYLATLEVGRRKEDAVLPPSEMDSFSTEQHISLAFSMASRVYRSSRLCSTPVFVSLPLDSEMWLSATTGMTKQSLK